jgi:hypothetical protein
VRGLAPPPVDVARLVQEYDINGHQVSIGLWLFNPSFIGITSASAETVLDDWFVTCLPSLYELQHEGVIATTCRLELRGFRWVAAAPPGHGAWVGGQADNVALGLHWLTGEVGKGLSPITFVPGVPDVFIANNYRLNELAYGNLRASSSDLYDALNALHSPDGTPTVVGTLHRVTAGTPMPTAQFAPYVGVVPTLKVATIRRRIPARGQIAPV